MRVMEGERGPRRANRAAPGTAVAKDKNLCPVLSCPVALLSCLVTVNRTTESILCLWPSRPISIFVFFHIVILITGIKRCLPMHFKFWWLISFFNNFCNFLDEILVFQGLGRVLNFEFVVNVESTDFHLVLFCILSYILSCTSLSCRVLCRVLVSEALKSLVSPSP